MTIYKVKYHSDLNKYLLHGTQLDRQVFRTILFPENVDENNNLTNIIEFHDEIIAQNRLYKKFLNENNKYFKTQMLVNNIESDALYYSLEVIFHNKELETMWLLKN